MHSHGIAEGLVAAPKMVGPSNARPSSVLLASHRRELEQIKDPQVQAVIWAPEPVPSWIKECAAAVCEGRLTIARTNKTGLNLADIETLTRELVADGFSFSADLRRDVSLLARELERISGWRRFQFRIFTEAPSVRCGFHVDTVPPGLPPIGVMRVYSGSPTLYAERADVASMSSFYHYLSRRERLLRDMGEGTGERAPAQLIELDRSPEFLRDGATPRSTPPGAVVAFKHLDAADHWNGERSARAWIHTSPMTGERRLVVNVCPSR